MLEINRRAKSLKGFRVRVSLIPRVITDLQQKTLEAARVHMNSSHRWVSTEKAGISVRE